MGDLNVSVGQRERRTLFLIAIIFIGFNLRPAITSVGPLLGIIRDQLNLANWSAGLITSLPLISFAVVSPIAPKIGRILTNSRAILLGLFLLILGIVTRSIPQTITLYLGTATIGIGIAIMNVILPAVIKDHYPDKVGRMTSVYSTSMSVFSAIGSGLSVPLAGSIGLGWEFSLLSWGILAIIGIAIWILATEVNNPNKKITNQQIDVKNDTNNLNIWKSPLAWQVTFFMGFQSFIFYVTISWLPEILQSFGFSVATAGWLVSYTQFIGLPMTFLAPILAEKFTNQIGIVLGIGAILTIGFTGLLIGGPLPLIFIWITLIGFSLGGSISLALTMIGLRSQNATQAGMLSGMAQSVGYLLAAIGPMLIGYFFDLTSSWSIPLWTIIFVCILMTGAGIGAGRNKTIQ